MDSNVNSDGSAKNESNQDQPYSFHDHMPQPEIFKAWYYLAQNPQVKDSGLSPWEHFCQIGFAENLNAHPLFDTKFYRETHLRDQPNVNPILHYLERPSEQLDTHCLFNVAFYVGQLDQEALALKENQQTWLEYFLQHNLQDLKSPSPQFSSERYVNRYPDISQQGLNPLFHYVAHGQKGGREKFNDWSVRSPLFDERAYLDNNDDIRTSKIDPWRHYCEFGHKENRNPNPIFNTAFYRQKYLPDQPDIDPLAHYERQAGRLLDTHPLFDAAFYLSQIETTVDEMAKQGITPLEHFLKFNRDNLASPSPLFSTKRYIEKHKDVAECRANPLYNFLAHGQYGGRQSFVDLENLELLKFRTEYEVELMKHFEVPHQDFITSMAGASANRTIICVSHEASMTGAPLIILRVAEKLHSKYGVDIINVLCRGGELTGEFELLGPTIQLDGATWYRREGEFYAAMDLFHDLVATKNVLGAIVNSAESRHMLAELRKLNIPIHSLIHENARCYPEGEFKQIAELSDKVIFPSKYVQDAAFENAEFPDKQTDILPQGLLNEELLKVDSVDRSAIVRRKFDIPTDATFVLSCGTRDGRKGLDLFISTAIIALEKAPKGTLYFGWLGGSGHTDNTQHAFWATKDLETAGISEYVKFLGQTDNVTPYFQACDLLFLPSRMDPFPCVVNEAMAVAKPVVLFDQGSGCVNLIKNEGGAVVPYGNVARAADSIIELSKYPELRGHMGKRNRDYVTNHMNYDSYVEQILDGLVASMAEPEFQLRATAQYTSLRESLYAKTNQEKVIFALPAWNVSGVNTFVENLIIELRKHNYDASILFTTRDSGKVPHEHMPKVPYRYLTTKTIDAEDQRDRVVEYLKLNSPCVFVPNYDYIASSVSPQLPDNVGVLGVLHCDDDEHYVHGYQLGHYWDAMVAVSETIKEKMLALNPAFADRTHTIRYGIPVNHDLRDKVFSSDKIRLVYTGRIIQTQKRIFDFIELLKQLDTKQVPYEMTFVGGGPDEVAFLSELKPWLDRNVAHYLGRVSPKQVREELEKSDALILTSEFEGLPLSLLEAMAHQVVPVVTHIQSGVSEILKHRENAMLSPVYDMEEMAKNIETLYRDPELTKRLSEEAYKTLPQYKLTAAQMGEQYEAVIAEIFKQINSERRETTIPLDCPHVTSMLNAA